MRWIAALTLAVCPLIAAERTAVIEKTFDVGTGPAKLIVDNVWGGIEVTADGGNRISITVDQRWTGDSEADLDRGQKEVKLDITQEAGTVRLYVDGPFRCRGGVSVHDELRYEPRFNFRAHVPAHTALELKTVLRGDVHVSGTTGDFDLSNVNGGVDATDIAGSGHAHTVNGPVRVSFRENPRAATSFKTINGEITTTFQPGLSADLRIKTMPFAHRDAFTDFEVTALPLTPVKAEREGGRFVYRSGDTRLRIGNGGSELSYETINGTIRIEKRGK